MDPGQAQLLLLHQICFDLYENASQQFLREVRQTLPRAPPAGSAAAAPSAPAGDETMAVDGGAAAAAATADGPAASLLPPPEVLAEAARIDSILSGEVTTRLHLEFLFRNNKTDLSILRATKTATEGKVSALHSAVVFANAIMHAGTSVDVFLRENLDWLGRASNWAKFSAVATLGVIHKARPTAVLCLSDLCALRVLTRPTRGAFDPRRNANQGHLSQGHALLAPYLPQQGTSGSPYSEGGALFALGLIHANHSGEVVQMLQRSLSSAQKEIVQHGAALGLGVAAMGTDDAGASPRPAPTHCGVNALARLALTPRRRRVWRLRARWSRARQRSLRRSRPFCTPTRRWPARPPASRWAWSCSAPPRTWWCRRCSNMRGRRSTRKSSAASPSASR